VPWSPPNIWTSIPTSVANAALDDIDAGLSGGKRRYSDAPNAKDRAVWGVVRRHVPSLNAQQCRAVIKTWIENGVLNRRPYHDPEDRKNVSGLFVAKRPGDLH
jgi:hypothetical protein